MPLPNINIAFTTQAASAIQRSQKGVVAIIVRDTAQKGAHILTNVSQIPNGLSEENKEYIKRAFLGYINPPRKVVVYVLPTDATNLTEALNYLASQTFDYLVGPPDITAAECSDIVAWIKAQREAGATPKAVLPNVTADSEAIINFTTSVINVGDKQFSAAEYCSRIAGLIAGTPMTISCTYAPLPEVTDVVKLTKEEMDEAIDNGEFIIFYDGEKVKVGRGVNSLKTTTQEKGEAFKKIKIVEAIDMIKADIRKTIEDNYIGKYANSYDNKCLLVSAILGYFKGLEAEGILETSTSSVEIDVDAQEKYLQSKGVNTENMTEDEIKKYPTDDKVFVRARIKILDAIEDVELSVAI